MEVIHGLSNTKADLSTATTECPICQHQTPTLSPQYGTISLGDQPATWWQVGHIGLLPSWKGQCFVRTGIDIYSGCGFAFLACNASTQTTMHGFAECHTHCHGVPHGIAFHQGAHFVAKQGQPWAQGHRIHWPCHVPHHPETAGLIEQWNGLLKIQLQCQRGGHTWLSWGKILEKAG